jgi:hypothetical protein
VSVREASPDDLDSMVALADAARRRYAAWSPTFHRPAADAVERHRPWLERLVTDPDVGSWVSTQERAVQGFLVATLVPAPPVYDPGGPTCLVDDFVVEETVDGEAWATTGHALLDRASAWAREHGAVQVVVTCGPRDAGKRSLLVEYGLGVVTEWFTAPLAAAPPGAAQQGS